MSSTVSSTPASAGSTVISSTGIGSGLDIGGIVTSLTTAHGLAQNTQLSDRKSTLTAQVSAYGTFKSALDTLQATLATLENPKALAGRTFSPSIPRSRRSSDIPRCLRGRKAKCVELSSHASLTRCSTASNRDMSWCHRPSYRP